MALLTCGRCNNVWNGSVNPFCPSCIEHDWYYTSGLLDPNMTPDYYQMCSPPIGQL